MIRRQDTDVFPFQGLNDFLEVGDRNGINSGKRLIQQQESRRRGQGPRDFQPAALTAGKREGFAVSNMG